MLVKDKIHKLIDSIKDENALNGYLNLISKLNDIETGSLYNSLNEDQKRELNLSYEESEIDSNLLPHSEVRESHSKWL
jgi:hypothetical protein